MQSNDHNRYQRISRLYAYVFVYVGANIYMCIYHSVTALLLMPFKWPIIGAVKCECFQLAMPLLHIVFVVVAVVEMVN